MTRDSNAMILFLIIFIFFIDILCVLQVCLLIYTFKKKKNYMQRNLLLESTTKWLLEMESSLMLVLSWNMHHIHVRWSRVVSSSTFNKLDP